MGHGTYLRLLFVSLTAAMLWAGQVCGQSPSCVNHSSAPSNNPEKIKIVVDTVEFSIDDQLTEAQRAEITSEIRKLDLSIAPGEQDEHWAGNLEVARTVLEHQGYFRADIETTPHLLKAEAKERHYAITLQIEPGPQYRLGTVRFENARAFAPSELRKTIRLQEGDLFDASKIREGLKAMEELYATKGYVDATPEPDFTIEEQNGRVDLVLKIDEAKQYRIGTVEIFGLNSRLESNLRDKLFPGQVFDRPSFNRLLEEDKSLPPIGAVSENGIQIRRNSENATVDLMLNFRSCS